MKCSFPSKDRFSCEDLLCTGEEGLVELKIAGGIQYHRLRGAIIGTMYYQYQDNRKRVMNYIRAENCGNLDFLNQPSNYQEKLRCHAHDGRTEEDGKWKIEQCSGRPETAIHNV